jgi:hypothetical protein
MGRSTTPLIDGEVTMSCHALADGIAGYIVSSTAGRRASDLL